MTGVGSSRITAAGPRGPPTLADVQQLSAAVAAVVRSLLEERGWSGRQLARATGINQASVARKLREESPFDLDDVHAIDQAMSVDVGELVYAAMRLLG
jgi:DNA-binding Xre family transcriptional regulator